MQDGDVGGHVQDAAEFAASSLDGAFSLELSRVMVKRRNAH